MLCQSVAVGRERTLEQDPAFAFRIIVDIASKGLSPAINDDAERLFPEPEDRALADASDIHGVGGKRPSSETGRHESAPPP